MFAGLGYYSLNFLNEVVDNDRLKAFRFAGCFMLHSICDSLNSFSFRFFVSLFCRLLLLLLFGFTREVGLAKAVLCLFMMALLCWLEWCFLLAALDLLAPTLYHRVHVISAGIRFDRMEIMDWERRQVAVPYQWIFAL